MPKSTRRNLFGTNTRGQTVTVIEAPTRYSQRRKAIVAFWVTLFTVGLLTGTVLSHYLHPIVGGLLGVLAGVVLGVVLFALIVAWPVLRIIWHWLPEIGASLTVVYGWTWLMTATPLWLALVLVVLGVGVPAACDERPCFQRDDGRVVLVERRRESIDVVVAAAFARSRHWVLAPAWCLIVRHRLRMCFAAFIATNREGTLPLILLARPTPAGERVWLWLRPGLSIHDLEQEGQLKKLAVACWADQARVVRASRKYAALIRVDITRRDTLSSTVLSTLPDHVPADMPATAPVPSHTALSPGRARFS